MSGQRLTVYVDDHSHFMDESVRRKIGEFEDRETAVAACERIVDECLAKYNTSLTAGELFKLFGSFGEDPWIDGNDADCRFSARDYALRKCRENATKKRDGAIFRGNPISGTS
jgi:hypothetical protein